jgi:hypothetical protein
MSIFNKELNEIDENDLRDLVTNHISEGRTIEYKKILPSMGYEQKKEFLADVSSFANAIGGDLIFGIIERNGIAHDIIGIEVINEDAEILRIENIIQSNIEPRISGVSIKAILLANSKVVIILRIRKSLSSPHVVKIEKHWRFYSRNSKGKYPLDVQEVKSAFLFSETTGDKIRNFRAERIASLYANDSPVKLDNNPFIVLHIIPLSTFYHGKLSDISSLYGERHNLIIEWSNTTNSRFNFDGFLVYPPITPNTNSTFAYAQFYRNGIVEAVDAITIKLHNGRKIIPYFYEKVIINILKNFIKYQKQLGVDPPFIVFLSFLKVFDHVIALKNNEIGNNFIDRDMLLTPDIFIEDYESNLPQALHPLFDIIWNASGYMRSMNYDTEGNWALQNA